MKNVFIAALLVMAVWIVASYSSDTQCVVRSTKQARLDYVDPVAQFRSLPWHRVD